MADGFNENYAPVWMQEAGYNTYYAGKLMNGHSIKTYNNSFPAGWNETNCKLGIHNKHTVRVMLISWPVLIEPNIYVYYNGTYQKNQDPPHYQPGRYSTDVVAESALEYLEQAASDEDRPFFINIAPVGPHFEAVYPSEGSLAGNVLYPPVPAKRHEHLFPNVTIPRTENFNPETVSPLPSPLPHASWN